MPIPPRSATPLYRLTFDTNDRVLVAKSGTDGTVLSWSARARLAVPAFNPPIPDRLADFLEIAHAVYVADRVCPRRSLSADRWRFSWSRNLELTIPVRDRGYWMGEMVGTRLADLLWLYTEDIWRFSFVYRRAAPQSRETQGVLLSQLPLRADRVALFSGGLDSLLGLCGDASDSSERPLILVSGLTASRVGAVQRKILKGVRSHFRRELASARVPFGFQERQAQYGGDERSQRSRGFIFQAIGAVIALSTGARSLSVYENGVGAINIPYSEAQLGAQSTRGSHPHTLYAMSEFVSLIAGAEFVLQNPLLFTTKGQLCGGLSSDGLGHLALLTISCDSYPQRVPLTPQCGVCTSCLLRRQSLFVAGLERPGVQYDYRYDVLNPGVSIPAQKLSAFRAMCDQVEQIRGALGDQSPWLALTQRYPRLAEAAEACLLQGGEALAVQRGLLDLYGRYCDEWGSFAEAVAGVQRSRAA